MISSETFSGMLLSDAAWYDLKKQRRPPLPAVYPKNQAAAERIFAFIEILKDVMKRKGYQERRKPIAK